MPAITITLRQIRAQDPCASGWEKLLRSKGKTSADDEAFPLTDVLDSNGLDDCLQCLRCLPEHDRLWRRLAVHYARQVQHIMTDPRSLAALDVADRHWQGLATDEELEAAWAAADPDHDWRIVLNGPLSGRTYQRHAAGEWALIEQNQGFA